VYVPDELDKEFKKRSMGAYGYGRGSISKAAAEAMQRWVSERDVLVHGFKVPEDPVRALKGMLKHVRRSSVELHHDVKKIRSRKMGMT